MQVVKHHHFECLLPIFDPADSRCYRCQEEMAARAGRAEKAQAAR